MSKRNSISRGSVDPGESTLTKSNLNPILRINRGSPTTATTQAVGSTISPGHSPTASPSSSLGRSSGKKVPVTTGTAGTPVSPTKGNKKGITSTGKTTSKEDGSQRSHRRSSSSAESLRKHIERAGSPSGSVASRIKPSTPTSSVIRRSSPSSSSIDTLSTAQTTPESYGSSSSSSARQRLRPSSPSAATVQTYTGVAFPSTAISNNSPVASSSSSPTNSILHVASSPSSSIKSIDYIKSSLRDTLGTGQNANMDEGKRRDNERETTRSSPPTVKPASPHKPRRSVSFAAGDVTIGQQEHPTPNLKSDQQAQNEKRNLEADRSYREQARHSPTAQESSGQAPDFVPPNPRSQLLFNDVNDPEQVHLKEAALAEPPSLQAPFELARSVFSYVRNTNGNNTTEPPSISGTSKPFSRPRADSAISTTGHSTANASPTLGMSPDEFFREYVQKVMKESSPDPNRVQVDRRIVTALPTQTIAKNSSSSSVQFEERKSDVAVENRRSIQGYIGNLVSTKKNLIYKVTELVIGLWLALIWLAIGKVLGLGTRETSRQVKK